MIGDPPEYAPRVPLQLPNSVKAKAETSEERWTTAAVFIGLAGAGVGVAFAPAGAILAVVSSTASVFALRAKAVRKDPPRGDFELAAQLRPPRINPLPLFAKSRLTAGAVLASALDFGSAYLETVVTSFERAAGAEWDGVSAARDQRLSEAQLFAVRSEPMLTAIGAACDGFARELETDVRRALEKAPPAAVAQIDGLLGEYLATVTQGEILAAGADPGVLEMRVDMQGRKPAELIDEMANAVREAGVATAELGRELLRWGTDGLAGQPAPGGAPLMPYDPKGWIAPRFPVQKQPWPHPYRTLGT